MSHPLYISDYEESVKQKLIARGGYILVTDLVNVIQEADKFFKDKTWNTYQILANVLSLKKYDAPIEQVTRCKDCSRAKYNRCPVMLLQLHPDDYCSRAIPTTDDADAGERLHEDEGDPQFENGGSV